MAGRDAAKELEAISEQLLEAAMPELRALVAEGRVAVPRQKLEARLQGRRLTTTDLLRATARAYRRVDARRRERLRVNPPRQRRRTPQGATP